MLGTIWGIQVYLFLGCCWKRVFVIDPHTIGQFCDMLYISTLENEPHLVEVPFLARFPKNHTFS